MFRLFVEVVSMISSSNIDPVDDDVGNFFAEINQIEAEVVKSAPVQVVVAKPQVIVRAPEIKEVEYDVDDDISNYENIYTPFWLGQS